MVGLEMMRSVNEENEEEKRKVAIVRSAINTLSYSELEAILHIFDELDGNEGILVASRIADRVGITRSVIVNALRKFESAGVIESRSSGSHLKRRSDNALQDSYGVLLETAVMQKHEPAFRIGQFYRFDGFLPERVSMNPLDRCVVRPK